MLKKIKKIIRQNIQKNRAKMIRKKKKKQKKI